MLTTLKHWLKWCIQVQHRNPDVVRRGRLLNLFLLIGAMCLGAILLLELALPWVTFRQFLQHSLIFSPFLLIALLMLFLTRRGHGQLVGYISLILILVLTLLLSESSRYFLHGPGTGLYIVVIFVASVTISPLAGTIFSILSVLNIVLIGLVHNARPSLSTMIAPLSAGVVAWIIAHYLERANQDLARQSEVYQELDIARQTQISLLPDTSPNLEGFDIAGFSFPSRDVGGDFFSYHPLDAGRLAVVVGDVSGKGMPAALLMAVATGAIGTAVLRSSYPAAFMSEVEEVLQPHADRSRLNTALCYVLLDRNFHTLQVCNAGLISPILRRNGRAEYLEAEGLPLGYGLYEVRRDTLSLQIDEGDLIVVVSDGIVEARNPKGELFSFERLVAAINAAPDTAAAQDVVGFLLRKVKDFARGSDWPDDITIVAMRVL
ncbi:MAG: PP2C family protein-serine/threonine phosphatase [Anaerolineae bacterium]